MWQPLVERLPGRRIIMFDFPGTGESSLPWFPPTMAHNAAFVRRLMRKLGLGRADVLGYSWGGLLAQQLAAQHPTVVRRLVLACTGPGLGSIPSHPRVAARLLTPRRYHDSEYLARIASDTYGGRFRREPSLVEEEAVRRKEHPPKLAGYATQVLSAGTFSVHAIAPFIVQRTLILAGDDDPLVRTKNQYILHRAIRNSELQVFAGAGHLLLLDSPEDAAPLIDRSLR